MSGFTFSLERLARSVLRTPPLFSFANGRVVSDLHGRGGTVGQARIARRKFTKRQETGPAARKKEQGDGLELCPIQASQEGLAHAVGIVPGLSGSRRPSFPLGKAARRLFPHRLELQFILLRNYCTRLGRCGCCLVPPNTLYVFRASCLFDCRTFYDRFVSEIKLHQLHPRDYSQVHPAE